MTAGRVAFVAFVLTACGGLSGSSEGSSGSDDAGGGVGASGGSAGSAGSGSGARGGSAGSATSGAGGSNAAGAGSGGGAARGGTAGACASEDCLTFFTMSDFETAAGWPPALGVAGAFGGDPMPYVVLLEPPRDASRFALHLDEPEEPGGADLTFHQHFPMWVPNANGLGEPYVGVRFWAKRGELGPTSVIVAITGLAQQQSDYVADLEAGRPWLVHRFALTRDWQRYLALFRDFGPEGDGERVPASDPSGQVVHFIVPSGEPLDLWLDDIEIACAPGTC